MVGRPRDDFEKELFPILPFLRAFAQKLTFKSELAEDLYGDTILRLIAHKADYIIGSNIKAWSFFIMRNLWYSNRRRAWRSVEWNDDFARTICCGDNPLRTLELKEVLESMRFLPPEQVEAIEMIAQGMSYEDVAAETGVEVGTVKSRVSRGREQLERLFAS